MEDVENTRMPEEVELSGKSYYLDVSLEEAETNIHACLRDAARNVIATGHYLKVIRDKELYREAGYENIWDYAAERFGFSKSTASRYMARNDKFSVGGNSPILAEEFREYSKAQLQEMLSLDAEQMGAVTPDMTVREIRELRKPKELPYYEIPGQLDISDFPGMEDAEETENASAATENSVPTETAASAMTFAVSVEDLIGEQEEESVATSQQNVKQDSPTIREFIKSWKEILPEEFRRAMRAMREGKSTEEKAQQIQKELSPYGTHYYGCSEYSFSLHSFAQGMDWEVNGKKLHLTYVRLASELLCMYDPQSSQFDENPDIDDEDEEPAEIAGEQQQEHEEKTKTGKCIHDGIHRCMLAEEDKEKVGTGADCSHHCCWMCAKRGDCKLECDASAKRTGRSILERTDANETDELIDPPEEYNREVLVALIEDLEARMEQFGECWKNDSPKIYTKKRMEINAYKAYLEKMDQSEVEQNAEEVEQPELPLLKNDKQRAEFIDAYEAWPLWIDNQETGERYYRYDLPDGTSFVIKTYHAMLYDYNQSGCHYKEGYGENEQYLLEPGKFFRDCRTNRSTLIEKLKELQKTERDGEKS